MTSFLFAFAPTSKFPEMTFIETIAHEQIDTLLIPTILVVVGLWLAALAVYRLYLSPLSKFPGPKFAALTSMYEMYFDIIKGGQFTFHMQELHKRYGKIFPFIGSPNNQRSNHPNQPNRSPHRRPRILRHYLLP